MLKASFVLFVFVGRGRHNVAQFGPVEEISSVLQNVFGTIIDALPEKNLDHAHKFGVRSEVLLIFNSQFQLMKTDEEKFLTLPFSFQSRFAARE